MRYSQFEKNQGQFYFPEELIIDNFAGGGGASIGIEIGCGRPVDHAINHDPEAIAVHETNHPLTKHWCESVWDVDPLEVTKGLPVGLAWFSPDCKHFSKAKGSKPVDKKIRGLAWIVLRWIAKVKPRIIMLENVEEFTTWGPLVDGKPCPKRKGQEFKSFIRAIERNGYKVEYKQLRACDYGSPTTRKRFFMVARCDGEQIAWPEPTHAAPNSDLVKSGKLKPWRTAAEIIDWSIPTKSIFDRKKPLAENTLKRIAKGFEKFVIHNPKPFIISYYGAKKEGEFRGVGLNQSLPTQTTENRFALVTPFISRIGQTGFGGDRMSYNAESPLTTITSKAEHLLVTSHLLKLRNGNYGSDLNAPCPTLTAGGNHIGEVRAFLIKYYGNDTGQAIDEPVHTVVTKDRFGLVTIHGQNYQIADIGMRMLQPHELFAAQGFPEDYQHEIHFNEKQLTKKAQVRLCGNSVCPDLAAALVKANYKKVQSEKTKSLLSNNEQRKSRRNSAQKSL